MLFGLRSKCFYFVVKVEGIAGETHPCQGHLYLLFILVQTENADLKSLNYLLKIFWSIDIPHSSKMVESHRH